MKHPLVAVVLIYAAGLLLAECLHPPFAALFVIALIILAAALFLEKFRPLLLWPLLALAGWINLLSHTSVVSPNDLRNVIGNEAALVTVRGTMLERPDLKIYERDGNLSEHTLGRIRVSALQRDGNWQPAIGSIVVTAPTALSNNFFSGETVAITGVIAPPSTAVAEGLFDYRNHLSRQGIYFQLKTYSPGDWQLLSTNATPPWSDRFLAWSKKTLAYGLTPRLCASRNAPAIGADVNEYA